MNVKGDCQRPRHKRRKLDVRTDSEKLPRGKKKPKPKNKKTNPK